MPAPVKARMIQRCALESKIPLCEGAKRTAKTEPLSLFQDWEEGGPLGLIVSSSERKAQRHCTGLNYLSFCGIRVPQPQFVTLWWMLSGQGAAPSQPIPGLPAGRCKQRLAIPSLGKCLPQGIRALYSSKDLPIRGLCEVATLGIQRESFLRRVGALLTW